MNQEFIVSLVAQLPVVIVFYYFMQMANKQHERNFSNFANFFKSLRAEDQRVTEKIVESVTNLEKEVNHLASMLIRHDELSRQSFNVYLSRDLKDQQDEFERKRK